MDIELLESFNKELEALFNSDLMENINNYVKDFIEMDLSNL